MNITGHSRDEIKDSKFEFIDERRPPEELDDNELIANAAAEIYRAGKRDDALRFFSQYDELAGKTKEFTSFVWCHASGKIVALVTHDTNDYTALVFDPEVDCDDFETRIAKREHYIRQQSYSGPQMPEQTFYFGDEEVAQRLKAREKIDIDSLSTPEEVVGSALARQAWSRHEATFGISFQNQRAYMIESGHRSQISDAEPLRKLLERIKPAMSYETSAPRHVAGETSDDQSGHHATSNLGATGLEMAFVEAELT